MPLRNRRGVCAGRSVVHQQLAAAGRGVCDDRDADDGLLLGSEPAEECADLHGARGLPGAVNDTALAHFWRSLSVSFGVNFSVTLSVYFNVVESVNFNVRFSVSGAVGFSISVSISVEVTFS